MSKRTKAPTGGNLLGYRGKMIFVIPDVQDKPHVSKKFLRSIGKYIVHKQPDIIVCLGDFADMESLSTWDKKTLKAEGKRYAKDVASAKEAMEALLGPMRELNLQLLAEGKPIYRPEMHMLEGNHEHRIPRAVEASPEMDNTLSIKDLDYEMYGWKVHKFLKVVNIEGVAFSHYFTSGLKGLAVSSAATLLTKKHQSCVAGHQQGYQIATAVRADGKMLTGLISGSCYLHNEDYLGPQGNQHWRGFMILHDVKDGEFSTQQVSLKHLNAKFPFEGYARKVSRKLLSKPETKVSLADNSYLVKVPKGVDLAKIIAKGMN